MSDKLLKALPTRNYLLSTEGVPESNVPSKVLLAHILKMQLLDELSAPQLGTEDVARVEKCSEHRGHRATVYNNYAWWAHAYKDRYFSERDMNDFIKSGMIEIARLTEKTLYIREGLLFSRLL